MELNQRLAELESRIEKLDSTLVHNLLNVAAMADLLKVMAARIVALEKKNES